MEIHIGSDADLSRLLTFAPNGGGEWVVDAERHDSVLCVVISRSVGEVQSFRRRAWSPRRSVRCLLNLGFSDSDCYSAFEFTYIILRGQPFAEPG